MFTSHDAMRFAVVLALHLPLWHKEIGEATDRDTFVRDSSKCRSGLREASSFRDECPTPADEGKQQKSDEEDKEKERQIRLRCTD